MRDPYGDFSRPAASDPYAAIARPATAAAMSAPEPPRRARIEPKDLAYDALMGAGDAFTLGWGDELAGLINPEWQTFLRSEYETAARDNPAAFYGGQLAIGLAPGFGVLANAGRIANGGRLLTQGASLGQKALGGAAIGATAGGIYGAGSGRTLEERATGAVGGAAVGGAFGGLLAPAMAMAGRAAQPVGAMARQVGQSVPGLRNVPGIRVRETADASPQMSALAQWPLLNRLPGARPTTSRADALLMDRVGQDLAPDGGDVADALDAVYRSDKNRGGSPPSLLDLTGENTSRLTEFAAALPGPGRNLMRQEVDRRIGQQEARVEQIINKKTGAPAKGGDSLRTTLAAIDEEQRRLAGPLYAKVRDLMLRSDERVRVAAPNGQDEVLSLGEMLARPSMQRATERAAQLAREFGIDLDLTGLRPGGELTRHDARIRLDLLNWVKMGLDAELSMARNPMSNIDKTERAAMARTAAQFVQVMDGLVTSVGRPGEYAAARTMYGGIARMRDAAELGRRVFAPGEGGHSGFLDDARELLYPNATDKTPVLQKAEIKAALAGMRDALLERAYSASDGRDLYKAVLGNKAVRQRIAAVFGPLTKKGRPNVAARGFFNQVFAEADRLRRVRETYSRTGSQTAPRQFEADAVNQELDEAFINTLFEGLQGNWLQAITNQGRGIVQALAARDPLTTQEARQVVERAITPLSAQSGSPLMLADMYRRIAAEQAAQRAQKWRGRPGQAGGQLYLSYNTDFADDVRATP